MGTPKVEIPGPTRCVGCCHTSRALGPRVLASAEVPAGAPCPPEVRDLWKPGTGYGIHIDFPQAAVRRLDPRPRLAVLIGAGVLPADHQAVIALNSTFDRVLAASPA